ncbi:cysteine-rich with EGF-like domain protein 2 isoform X2 [Leguminivora glycinivorella]|nr:cysteine-rich with EGF-like domain protein 2 isoform X2 [Leguminivora glycinivorella]
MGLCYKLLYVVFSLLFASDVARATDENRARNDEPGPCNACKVFAESFEKGLHRTAPVFASRSQERLTNILQGVCEEARYKNKCLETAGVARAHTEHWWLQDEPAEFFQYICIDKLEVCCPKHHYGRACQPCLRDAGGAVCGAHGRCRGDGTRLGNGTCHCDAGYKGELCEDCVTGYYKSSEDSGPECKRCHYSCTGGCRGGAPLDCVACRPGFTFEPDVGCHDNNECNDINICAKNEFCLNSAGSYKCMACDRACKGCYGDSPDMCRKCAKGYSKKGDMCVREREDEEFDQMTTTRYMTYLGLLVAGGVLWGRAPALAAGVGALTLSYIALAEYYCRISGHASLLDYPLFTI